MQHRSAPGRILVALLVAAAAVAAFAPPAAAQARGEPQVVDMDVKPVLRNPEQMANLLQQLYPPLLKDAGIEGSAMVWIYIDEMGRVRETRLMETSGYVALDEAAESVAQLMSFDAARKGSGPIPVWIPMGINFKLPARRAQPAPARHAEPTPVTPAPESAPTRPAKTVRPAEPVAEPSPARPAVESPPASPTSPAGDVGAPPMASAPAEPEPSNDIMALAPPPAQEPDEDLSAAPTFTPMTVRPTLANPAELQAALIEHYPPLLRDAGIGGTVNVWFFIDEDGRVVKTQVNESSGYDAFDQAALLVANTARFTPARNRDEVVPVWIALDITFQVQ